MTMPNISRNTIQIVSLTFFLSGIMCYFLSSHEMGSILMGVGFYVVIMSESILLSRVQTEMTSTIERLTEKRESEIQDLLYFLRQSKMSSKPWEGIDAASLFIERLQIPAMIISDKQTVHKINKSWTALLGWTKKDLHGKRTEPIQCPDSFGPVSIELVNSFRRGEMIRHTRYCYINKSGERVEGTVLIVMFVDQKGALALFFPDSNNILN